MLETIQRRKSFKCDRCDFESRFKFNLHWHKRKQHLTSKSSSCNVPAQNVVQWGGANARADQSQEPVQQEQQQQQHRVHQQQQQQQQQQVQFQHQFENFFQEHGERWGDDQDLKEIYRRNLNEIRDRDLINRKSRTYIRYLNECGLNLMESIEQSIEQVYRLQEHSFKLNISFSFILQNKETEEYRYYYASNNTQLVREPKLIRNQEDLNAILNFLSAKGFPTLLKDQRPSTKWVIERIVSIRLRVIPETYPLGKPPQLPEFIKNNPYIISLEKDAKHGYHYQDNLCFFRCLSIAKFNLSSNNCNLKAKELFKDYCEQFNIIPNEFQGVELTDFPLLEKYYEVQLFGMTLQEDGTAKTIYLSQSSCPTKVYLNVFKHHLSLITDVNMYLKQYICNRCE